MAIEETRVVFYAREKHDRTEVWANGVVGTEEDYGKILVERVTKTTRRAEGGNGRKLGESEERESVFELDVEGARHLITTLTASIIASLQVQPPRHL